jgi:SAM-dependent methyltransferase
MHRRTDLANAGGPETAVSTTPPMSAVVPHSSGGYVSCRWRRGRGTGALAETIVELAFAVPGRRRRPVGKFPRPRLRRYGNGTTRFTFADAHALPFADASFDACASGLVLNFLDGRARALGEMGRVVRSRAQGPAPGYVASCEKGASRRARRPLSGTGAGRSRRGPSGFMPEAWAVRATVE